MLRHPIGHQKHNFSNTVTEDIEEKKGEGEKWDAAAVSISAWETHVLRGER